ncbi:HD-GYP domain, c-di-GMP phosphodiesterase class II (or its inactivated variant) [Ferrimonas sediminum]|uniref:HD-GYP domain, c-di-GMP phosphodiesterase class II (Or its inactivated variant) n=1 Tax=Ferrimonas sediminum TaxID=718193 RepID=A0A1G8VL94_9GAMM|nr:HD domain-containing phosphohydrolase [Ferrimonas sediminum]SDJ66724.1 HD-GYP domain, c-di-GMP phosphodiesterase class II (or its inactivated variant) [Ferrimonas sediminum]
MTTSTPKGVSIRVTVVFVFVIGTLVTATCAIGLQYLFASKMATEAVTTQATMLANTTRERVNGVSTKAAHSVELLVHNASLLKEGRVQVGEVDSLFASLLENNGEFYAVYLGLANGDFYELINLEASPQIRQQLGASLVDRFVKVIVRDRQGQRIKQTLFLDDALRVLRQTEAVSEYDARTRPWFQIASTYQVKRTEPYLFQHLQAPGQTFSMKNADSGAVVAVDIALSTMSAFLSSQLNIGTPIGGGEAFLFVGDGRLLASNQAVVAEERRALAPVPLSNSERAYLNSISPITVSNERDWAPLDYTISGQPRGYVVELTRMLADSLGLNLEYINGFSWSELTEHFHAGRIDVLTPVYRTEENRDWGIFSDPLVTMPMALATRSESPVYSSLADLSGQVIAVPAGWSIVSEIRRHYPQIDVLEVASVTEAMRAVIEGKAEAALETEVTLNYHQRVFYLTGLTIHAGIDIGAISFDSDLRYVFQPQLAPLAPLMNRALAQVSDQDRAYLEQRWLNPNDATEASLSRTVPYQALTTLAAEPARHGTLVEMSLDGRDSFVLIAPLGYGHDSYFGLVLDVDEVLAASRQEVYLSIAVSSLIILLMLPLCYLLANPIVNPIRDLAAENRKIKRRQYHLVSKRHSVIKEVDDLADSLVEMSAAIATHEARQQQLMDSFIEVIAQAIDDKSPYTGGHCRRVPELGLMLAEEASNSAAPSFHDFSIDNKDKYREFRLAAWLHDCGKISTPEHVVDKGSKLEANYNRIHEIRTRFEVLWRDCEIAYLQERLARPGDDQAALARKRGQQQKLQQEFEFVATCNVGGEFMGDDKVQRLQQIGAQTWIRHFDDRLGLSPMEERRLAPASDTLPVVETLLADKPEHRVPWPRQPDYDPKLGITLEPTELQNHLGELYNLCVSKGTLNSEERFRINEHMVGTIKILESLPFPPELANVPRFASTHHETLKGTGYPRQLQAEDLSVGERILVLADVFEALTADDRPYKKAKPLSVAIDILHKMVLDEHVDPEVFALFLSSGVYLKYAREYLSEAQIDEVDVEGYLKPGRSA